MASLPMVKGTPTPEDNRPTSIHVHETFSEEEERRVSRKIDCFILPIFCFVTFFQYLDKLGISYASVFGLIEDLSLNGDEYSWCSSILYVGQLVSEYPFVYLMSRLPLTRLVGITVIVWGGICMCLSATHSFAGFAALRFLLGFSEGAVAPAFVSLTSIWYRKKDHASRVVIWVAMNGPAQVLGSLLMYGIAKTSRSPMAAWRILFLVCGTLTSLVGFLFLLIVPLGPEKAWFLAPREREILLAKLEKDRDGGDQTKFSIVQFKETLLDTRSWFFLMFGVLSSMQTPVIMFASLIIKNLNYDRFQTILHTSPSGAVQTAAVCVGIMGTYLFPNNRCMVIICMCIPPLVGCILLLKLPLTARWGLIVSSWLASCISNVAALLASLSASNIKGNTKRATVNTLFFIGSCIASIAAPLMWKPHAAPRYFDGTVCAIVSWCLLIMVVCLYAYLCWFENKRRNKRQRDFVETVYHEGDDITDIQDKQFRYSY